MTTTPVVLDTNVFIAAGFNSTSASARLIAAVHNHQIRMIWNEATRAEIAYIVGKIPRLNWTHFVDLFRPSDHFIGQTEPTRFMYITDPDDRKFIALAAATGAVLITNDAHLLRERAHSPTAICRPKEFFSQMEQDN